MRSDIGLPVTPPLADTHTPTPKESGGGRESCHDSHGTPTGVWESSGLPAETRFEDQIAEWKRRKDLQRTVREEMGVHRRYGLGQRHAAKLARQEAP